MRRAVSLSALFVLAVLTGAAADPLGGPNTFPLYQPSWQMHPDRHRPSDEEAAREEKHKPDCENPALPADERIAACRELIDAKARGVNTWRALGDAYGDKGDFAAAIDAYTHNIVDDEIWLTRSYRAIAYARGGDTVKALEDADEFVRIDHENAQSLALRCRVRAIMDQEREAALKDCDAALAKEPHLANALNDRALLLYRLDRTADALAASDDALSFGGHLPLALYLRGMLKKRSGDAAGDGDIASALAADPAVPDQVAHYHPGRSKPQAADEAPPP